MGKIFSGAVSGNQAPHGLLNVSFAGPEWLTGGAAGMEGSPIGCALSAAMAMAFLSYAVRRGQIVTPIWKRRRDEQGGLLPSLEKI